ncbi:MAG: pyruvate/ketoisovalerate ferredoxin oxidoreductase subunit gamma [Geothermobacteraceae bacterium]
MEPKDKPIEIRWHGRGGQGAITAAKVVAKAAFEAGYGGVVMAPSFGTERRGAPVSTSLKLARDTIYDLSPITRPDIVVVLDHLILNEVDVTAGLKPGGWLIVNAPCGPEALRKGDYQVATANINQLAEQAGLKRHIVNSGIIGLLARATGLVDIERLARCLEEEFEGRRPQENARAARLSYDAAELAQTAGEVAHG